jgi:prolyl oligopeptidase
MPALMEPPPFSEVETVTDILHGMSVTDPYRWLEDQDSPRTREWVSAQTRYARSYLNSIPERERIRERIGQLLDVETCDSLQKVGDRYFFRKRLPGREQPSIYLREGIDGQDQVLVDPSLRGTGPHTAVKPLRVSSDGRLLLYEVKHGGERTGTFELLEIQTRESLPDVLPRGYLRGFAFAPDSRSFYYVHEALETHRRNRRVAYKHTLGTTFAHDEEVFFAGESENLWLHIVSGQSCLGFLVIRFEENIITNFYLWRLGSADKPEAMIRNANYQFGPILLKDARILAITDRDAPNLRIVEVLRAKDSEVEFVDVVPNNDSRIQNWCANEDRIFVCYLRRLETVIEAFDLSGKRVGQVPVNTRTTARLLGSSEDGQELFFEQESFTKPIETRIYRQSESEAMLWREP